MIEKRLKGAGIDVFVFGILTIGIHQFLLRFHFLQILPLTIRFYVSVALFSFIFVGLRVIGLYYYNGQTFGKYIYQIRVINIENESMLSITQCMQREFAAYVINITFFVGWILNTLYMIRSKEGYALHDAYARTKVVPIQQEEES